LWPLARLAVARGVTHATLDELLKQALVQAADAQHASLPPHRRVSRITTATGIHRREVSRLVELLRGPDGAHAAAGGRPRGLAPPSRSHASELFHHWRTNPVFCDRKGSPAELPRVDSGTGAAAGVSFEALAHGITRDVHPRSLLDELVRLGLAAHDRQRDTVRLVREAFVPQGDAGRMVRVLGNNVGAHLEAAVDNVLIDNRQHFEQALYADGLSDASMAELRGLVRDQWQQLMGQLVPALEAMVARDALPPAAASAEPGAPELAHPARTAATSTSVAQKSAATQPALPPRQQVRLGFYTHARPLDPSLHSGPAGHPLEKKP
jgi:hypothetical protein